ncbi:hypothetical protein B0H14DRAFT_2588340 [Mycena olivaceomarginata]|nr:hypothetical protein B0H14DRAFT_2588340 [Mycena olivaceomarginata]
MQSLGDVRATRLDQVASRRPENFRGGGKTYSRWQPRRGTGIFSVSSKYVTARMLSQRVRQPRKSSLRRQGVLPMAASERYILRILKICRSEDAVATCPTAIQKNAHSDSHGEFACGWTVDGWHEPKRRTYVLLSRPLGFGRGLMRTRRGHFTVNVEDGERSWIRRTKAFTSVFASKGPNSVRTSAAYDQFVLLDQLLRARCAVSGDRTGAEGAGTRSGRGRVKNAPEEGQMRGRRGGEEGGMGASGAREGVGRTVRRWQSGRAAQAGCKVDVRAPAGKGKGGNEGLKRDGDGDGDGARGAELDAYLEAGAELANRECQGIAGRMSANQCGSGGKGHLGRTFSHSSRSVGSGWTRKRRRWRVSSGGMLRRFASDVVFRELQWMR